MTVYFMETGFGDSVVLKFMLQVGFDWDLMKNLENQEFYAGP